MISDDESLPLEKENEVMASLNIDLDDEIIPAELLRKAQRILYVSHFCGQFSEIAWQFSLVIFLSACTNYRSLFLVSSYGIIVSLAVCIFGARVGRIVDRNPRLSLARMLICGENIAVVTASISCYLLLSIPYNANETFHDIPVDPLSIFLLLAIHLMGAVAQLMDRAFLVAIERDWVVVICKAAGEENAPAWLADTNVTMRQIDLSCKILAPTVIGILIPILSGTSNSRQSMRGACIIVAALNVISLIAEYVCTERIYRMIPSLAFKTNIEDPATDCEEEIHSSGFFDLEGIRIFFAQKSFAAGLALAMLYMNGLTFGNGIMSAYLISRNVPMESIGVLRGIASAIGLLGTFAFKASAKRFSLHFTGLWSIWFEVFCLSLAFWSLFVDIDSVALVLLVGGVCLSRIGLWVFDIAVTQMQQEEVPDKVRGIVGGTQQSLNALFTLVSFGVGLVFPDPNDFHIYVSAAAVTVGLAASLYYIGLYRYVNE